MAKQYRCSNCGITLVSAPGQICPQCMAQRSNADPFGFENSGGNYGFDTENAFDNNLSLGDDSSEMDPFGENPFSPSGSVPSGQVQTQDWMGDRRFERNSKPKYARMSASKGYTGRVQNVTSYMDNPKGMFLRRWFRSCMTGSAFSMAPCVVTMQVGRSAYESEMATSKQVYAFMTPENRNMFQPGTQVTVYGRESHSGAIYATSIVNQSTGMRTLGGTSAWVIRILMLAILGVCALLFSSAGQSIRNIQLVDGWEEQLGSVIAILIVALLFFFTVRRNPRLRRIVMFIGVFLIAAFINPSIGVLILIIMGIWILMGGYR